MTAKRKKMKEILGQEKNHTRIVKKERGKKKEEMMKKRKRTVEDRGKWP